MGWGVFYVIEGHHEYRSASLCVCAYASAHMLHVKYVCPHT